MDPAPSAQSSPRRPCLTPGSLTPTCQEEEEVVGSFSALADLFLQKGCALSAPCRLDDSPSFGFGAYLLASGFEPGGWSSKPLLSSGPGALLPGWLVP